MLGLPLKLRGLLVLIALAALPAIWLLLRITPPQPTRVDSRPENRRRTCGRSARRRPGPHGGFSCFAFCWRRFLFSQPQVRSGIR